jgi:hypothetical protein
MKKLLVLFSLLAFVPAFALAQAQPPPGAGGAPWPPRDSGQMRQNMQRMETLHKQFRAKVLGALTPAHRNLLASLAGQLAVSTSPDPKAAIAKLDAALTSGEKQAILNAAQSFMSQQRAMREQAIAKMRAANPNMPSPRPRPSGMERVRHTPDAGALLFMIATGGPGMMERHGGFMHAREFGPPGGFMRRPRPSPTP